MDIWVVSTFLLLWTVLPWTSVYKGFLSEYVFLKILFSIYLKVELLDHMVILCLIYQGTAKQIATVGAPFYFTFPIAMHEGSHNPFYRYLTNQEYNLTQNTNWSIMGMFWPPTLPTNLFPRRYPCRKDTPQQTASSSTPPPSHSNSTPDHW